MIFPDFHDLLLSLRHILFPLTSSYKVLLFLPRPHAFHKDNSYFLSVSARLLHKTGNYIAFLLPHDWNIPSNEP